MLLVGCRQHYESPDYVLARNDEEPELMVSEAISFLEFTSLENFLLAYISIQASDGLTATHVDNWSGASFEEVIRSTNFASFDTIALLDNIPEDFQIRSVIVTNYAITFRYLPANAGSDGDSTWDLMARNPSFEFAIWRQGGMSGEMDIILEERNATRADLINGVHLFLEPNLLVWEIDGTLFTLYFPASARGDMAHFAETRMLNMRDINAVMAQIQGVSQLEEYVYEEADIDIDEEISDIIEDDDYTEEYSTEENNAED